MEHVILITTYNRPGFLNQCLESIHQTASGTPIWVVNDGSTDATAEYLYEAQQEGIVDNIISYKENAGLAPCLNTAITAIDDAYRFKCAEDGTDLRDVWVSYVQDDVVFLEKDWPWVLFNKREEAHNKLAVGGTGIGFVTGHEAPEHEGSEQPCDIQGCLFRDHIRATHMMAPLNYWKSMLPIPIEAEDGGVRGHPSPGRGSDVDWWFIRGHENSVMKSNRTNLVVKGILEHIGHSQRVSNGDPTPEVEIPSVR